MRKPSDTTLDRRELFRAALTTAAVAVTGAMIVEPAAAASAGGIDKRRARYQADSAEVENFYRVNRYPAE